MEKIRDIVSLKEFDPVIDLSWAGEVSEQERLLENYVMTEDLAKMFVDILESITLIRSEGRRKEKNSDINPHDTLRAHVLTGSYGSGKSYFLLMLDIILEQKNEVIITNLLNKFEKFPELKYQIEKIRDMGKYFLVRINGDMENEKHFKDIIINNTLERMEEEFEDVKIRSVYKKYQEAFQNMYNKNKENVDRILISRNLEAYDIIAELNNYKRVGIEKAEEIIKEITGFLPRIETEDLKTFFIDAQEEIEKNGYREFVYIFDEFSAYINSSIEMKRINTDLGQVQTLAQQSKKNSDTKLSFILSTHLDMKSTLEKKVNFSQEELGKVWGRFNTSHNLKFDQGDELIKNVIKVDKNKLYNVPDNIKNQILYIDENFSEKIEEVYPIHPASLKYLRLISSIYAQKERTLFTFLKEVVKENYFGKNIIEDEKLNLITVDDIFDNFEEIIYQKKPNLYSVYKILKENSRDELDIKIVKALTIAYSSVYSSGNESAGLSIKEIADIFMEKEEKIKPILDYFNNKKYSNIILDNGKYKLLVNSTGIDLDAKIREESESININREMELLIEAASERSFLKEEYQLKNNMGIFPISRDIEGEIIHYNRLKVINLSTRLETKKDAKIIFVLPDFNDNFDVLLESNRCAEIIKDSPDNVAIVLCNKLYFNEEDIKEYGALKKLVNNEDVKKSEDLLKTVMKRLRKVEDEIRNKSIKKIINPKNYTYIFNSLEINKEIKSEKQLYSHLIKRYYPKFPYEITVENLDSRGETNAVIGRFIKEKGRVELSKGDTSRESKHFTHTLLPLDLIECQETVKSHIFTLKYPSKDKSLASYEIAEIIIDKETSIEEKFKKLLSSPYGLNEPIIELYFYILYSRKFIGFKKDGLRIEIKEAKELDFKNISKYELEFSEDTIKYNCKVKRIWEAINKGRIISTSSYNKFDPHSNTNTTEIGLQLLRELTDIKEKLKDICNILDEVKIKINGLDKFQKNLERVLNKCNYPPKLYDNFEEVLNWSSSQEIDIKIEETETLLETLTFFDFNNRNTIQNIYKKKSILKDLLEGLPKDNFLLQNLKNLELDWKEYIADYKKVDLIEKIKKSLEILVNEYNLEFEKIHNSYYISYNDAKNNFLEDQKGVIQKIRILENLKFNSILSLEDFLKELMEFKQCENLDKDKYDISICSCKHNRLKDLYNAIELITKEFEMFKKKLTSITTNYSQRIRDTELRKNISEKYSLETIEFKRFRELSANIDYPDFEIENLKVCIDTLKDIINNSDEGSDIQQEEEMMSFEELLSKLKSDISILGLKKISIIELKTKMNELIESYDKDIHMIEIKD